MKSRYCGLAAVACAFPVLATGATLQTTVRVEAGATTVLPLDRVQLDMTAPTTTINDTLDTDTLAVPSGSAFAQLAAATSASKLAFGFQKFDFGPMIQQIGSVPSTASAFWRLKINGRAAAVGAADAILRQGDDVSWALVTDWEAPELSLTVSADLVRAGAPLKILVRRVDNLGRTTPASTAKVVIGTRTVAVDATGRATVRASSGMQHIQAVESPASGRVHSPSLSVCGFETTPTECGAPSQTDADTDFVAPQTVITGPGPRARITRLPALHGLVTRDRSKIASIMVALAKQSAGRCRFVGPSGRLGVARPCSQRRWLDATRLSATKWTFTLPGALPLGSYRAWSRATDSAGNRESARRPRLNLIGFTIGANS